MSHEVANDRHPLPREGGRGEDSQAAEHPVLATEGLTIRFGGHVAVNNVTAEFRPGTLTAIVGPNGAGKTTYFNLISGQLPATSGSVRLYGEDITHLGAAQRTHRGIGRAFQLTNLFPNLTVLENVRMAVQRWKKYPLNPLVAGDRSSGVVVPDGKRYRLYTMHPDVRLYWGYCGSSHDEGKENR